MDNASDTNCSIIAEIPASVLVEVDDHDVRPKHTGACPFVGLAVLGIFVPPVLCYVLCVGPPCARATAAAVLVLQLVVVLVAVNVAWIVPVFVVK